MLGSDMNGSKTHCNLHDLYASAFHEAADYSPEGTSNNLFSFGSEVLTGRHVHAAQ